MRKFNTYVADNKVIVTTKYNGKTIKGVAKCSPEDKFDIISGAKLAGLRCEIKLLRKIQSGIDNDLTQKEIEIEKMESEYDKLCVLNRKIIQQCSEKYEELKELEKKLS